MSFYQCMCAEGFPESCPCNTPGPKDHVVDAAVEFVESLTAMPVAGLPPQEQPWVKAQASLAVAVDTYRMTENES